MAPKDESDRDGDATRRRATSSMRFRDALKRGSGNAESAGGTAGAAAGGPGWPRLEPLRVGAPPAPTGAVAAGKLAAANLARIDRLLVGGAGNEAEARIRIGSGALAGAEIKLTSTGAQSVTAQLLTPGAGSRETLSVAMEEIRLRLRDKGITLGPPVARGEGARRDGEFKGRGRSGERWPAGR